MVELGASMEEDSGGDRIIGNHWVLWFARLIIPILSTALLGVIIAFLNSIHQENAEYRSKVEARLEQSDGKLNQLQKTQDALGAKVTSQLDLFKQFIELNVKSRSDDIAQLKVQLTDIETRLRVIERVRH